MTDVKFDTATEIAGAFKEIEAENNRLKKEIFVDKLETNLKSAGFGHAFIEVAKKLANHDLSAVEDMENILKEEV